MDILGREMRKKERAMIPEECLEFLKAEEVGRLGLTDGKTRYIVPVNFVLYNGRIYIHSAKEGLKIDLIKHDNRVCFEVDKFYGLKRADAACDFAAMYKSVIVFGRVRFIDSEKWKFEVLTQLMNKYAGKNYPEIDKSETRKTTILEISLDKITGKEAHV